MEPWKNPRRWRRGWGRKNRDKIRKDIILVAKYKLKGQSLAALHPLLRVITPPPIIDNSADSWRRDK